MAAGASGRSYLAQHGGLGLVVGFLGEFYSFQDVEHASCFSHSNNSFFSLKDISISKGFLCWLSKCTCDGHNDI